MSLRVRTHDGEWANVGLDATNLRVTNIDSRPRTAARSFPLNRISSPSPVTAPFTLSTVFVANPPAAQNLTRMLRVQMRVFGLTAAVSFRIRNGSTDQGDTVNFAAGQTTFDCPANWYEHLVYVGSGSSSFPRIFLRRTGGSQNPTRVITTVWVDIESL